MALEFEAQRPRLFSLAYRMLGSAAEAEDAVQDTYLKWHGALREEISNPSAWLAKVLTNLCLNRLTSARVRRERYVGPWLPEPVRTDGGVLGPLETAEQRDSVSLAVLVLMERLTPAERACVVLRDAFEYSHREIAEVLDVSEAGARQTYRRAKQHLAEGRPRFDSAPAPQTELLQSFLAAAAEGSLGKLEALLAEEVVAWSDGGGKVRAAIRPVYGPNNVARFLLGVLARFGEGFELAFAEVNGAATVLAREDGQLTAAATVEGEHGRITGIRILRNPDKLAFLAAQTG
ncbi:RNA polymerase sigma-70 factor [Kitasatospora sp. NPDC002227]|uniref:RNA polymerase sigma-70 factor n=1 Tax=Kitasatospora sp. NPDC002227 TaxID=3154773 RepID=UPI003320D2D6